MPDDRTPDPFTFGEVSDVAPSSAQISGGVTIGGINVPVPVGVSGATYSINGSAFTSADGVIEAGDEVRLLLLASADFDTTLDAILTVGGVSGGFTVTTIAADTRPDAFTFNPIDGVMPGTTQTSNTVTITGLDVPVTITIENGQYRINDGAFTSEPGTLLDGDRLTLQVRAPEAYGETLIVSVDIGGEVTSFEISTATQLPDIVVDGSGGGGALGLPLIVLAGLGALVRRRR